MVAAGLAAGGRRETGARLTRRFIGVREPLDLVGYTAGFSLLIVGTVGSWMGRLIRHFPTTFILLALLLSLPLLLEVSQWLRRRRSAAPCGLGAASFP